VALVGPAESRRVTIAAKHKDHISNVLSFLSLKPPAKS